MTLSAAVIYSPFFMHINTVKEFVEGFSEMLEFDVKYIPMDAVTSEDLEKYDCIVVHYAVRLTNVEALPTDFIYKLEKYSGVLAIFLQDEYEYVNNLRLTLSIIQPAFVFTCVPSAHINEIYSNLLYPNTTFVNVLTGFAPAVDKWMNTPHLERSIDIGYRGRKLGNHYGVLGYEKWIIGLKVKELSKNYPGLKTDISTDESDRIYGADWFKFLGKCKSVLGTESGSNVFDFDGKFKALAEEKSSLSYQEFRDTYLLGKEMDGFMNQISPRIFEAASTRTAQILFEGNYSGIIFPWVHYVPLKKDFSNFDDVVEFLADDRKVNSIIENAFFDLIHSEAYSRRSYFLKIQSVLLRAFPSSSSLHKVESGAITQILGSARPQLEFRRSIASYSLPGKNLLRLFWRTIPFKSRIRLISKFDYGLAKISRLFKSL